MREIKKKEGRKGRARGGGEKQRKILCIAAWQPSVPPGAFPHDDLRLVRAPAGTGIIAGLTGIAGKHNGTALPGSPAASPGAPPWTSSKIRGACRCLMHNEKLACVDFEIRLGGGRSIRSRCLSAFGERFSAYAGFSRRLLTGRRIFIFPARDVILKTSSS